QGFLTISWRTSGCALMIARARPGCGWSDSDWKNAACIVFKLCIIVESSNALFHSRTTEQQQNETICRDIDDASGEDYETETLRRRKIGERHKGPGQYRN